MGVEESKHAPAPSPSPSPFIPAWRQVDWNKEALLQSVREYNRQNEKVKRINILLYGQVEAGKSSFVNSVSSILQGRMADRAPVGEGDGSFTLQYRTYKMKTQNSVPFVFNDIMGIERDSGIKVKDIPLIMKGHVKDGYKFDTETAMSDGNPLYNPNPTPEDQMHVVVCVVPADKVEILEDEVVRKIRRIRLAARDLGIPQVCIITKIDKVHPLMKKDVKNVYKMKAVKENMEQFAEAVGIPMSCIFPVKNYHEETDLHNDFDVLILKALKHMINVGGDCIDDM